MNGKAAPKDGSLFLLRNVCRRGMFQEELAETANVLHAFFSVDIAPEQQIEVRGNHVGGSITGCEMAVGGTGLTGHVMRAARLHFVIAAAKFPAMHGYRLRRNHAGNAGNAVFQHALNAMGKRHLRHGATLASTLKLYRNHAFFVNVYELDIAAVCLEGGANELEHCRYIGLLYHR